MSQSTLTKTPYTVKPDAAVPQAFIDHIVAMYPVGSGSWLTGRVESYAFDASGATVIKRDGNGREASARYPMSARWGALSC